MYQWTELNVYLLEFNQARERSCQTDRFIGTMNFKP